MRPIGRGSRTYRTMPFEASGRLPAATAAAATAATAAATLARSLPPCTPARGGGLPDDGVDGRHGPADALAAAARATRVVAALDRQVQLELGTAGRAVEIVVRHGFIDSSCRGPDLRPPRMAGGYPFTASRRGLPARNAGTRRELIRSFFPV